MKQFDFFSGDGGWRVALRVVNGGPVMADSPFFETRADAMRFARRAEKLSVNCRILHVVTFLI